MGIDWMGLRVCVGSLLCIMIGERNERPKEFGVWVSFEEVMILLIKREYALIWVAIWYGQLLWGKIKMYSSEIDVIRWWNIEMMLIRKLFCQSSWALGCKKISWFYKNNEEAMMSIFDTELSASYSEAQYKKMPHFTLLRGGGWFSTKGNVMLHPCSTYGSGMRVNVIRRLLAVWKGLLL